MADNQIEVRIIASLDELKSALGGASDEVKKFASDTKEHGKESGNAFEAIGESATAMRHTLEGLTDPIHGLFNDVGELAEAFLAAFAVEKIYEFAEAISEVGARAAHMSQELGMSTEAIGEFEFAAGAMGLGAQQADQGLMRLERSMGNAAAGSKRFVEMFASLGVSVTDASGKMRPAQEVLDDIAESFKNHENDYAKTTLAMELMGRAGAQMIPTLNEGKAGLEEMGQKAKETGTVLSGEMAEGMEVTAQNFHEMTASTQGLGIALFMELEPAINTALTGFTRLVEGIIASYQHGGAAKTVFEGLGFALQVVEMAIAAAAPVIDALGAGLEYISDNLLALSPVIAGVAALIAGPYVASMVAALAATVAETEAWELMTVAFEIDGIIGAVVTGIGALVVALRDAAIAQWELNAAMLANPMTLLLVGVSALVGGLVWLAEHTRSASDAFAVLEDVAEMALEGVRLNIGLTADVVIAFGAIAMDAMTLNWGAIAGDWANGLAGVEAEVKASANRIKSLADDMKSHLDFGGGKKGEDDKSFGIEGDEWGEKQSYKLPSQGEKQKKEKTPTVDNSAEKLDDQAAQAAEKAALEAIKVEQEKNRTLLALGRETEAQYTANMIAEENERWAAEQTFLQRKATNDETTMAKAKALYGEDSKQYREALLAKQKDSDALNAALAAHAEALLKINDDSSIQQQQMARKETENTIAELQKQLAADIKSVEDRFAHHQITSQQRAAIEKELTASTEAEILLRLNAEIASLAQGTEAYRAATDQKRELERKFSDDVAQINQKAHDQQIKDWQKLEQQIGSTFQSSLNGMLLGTQSWQKSLANVLNQIGNSFLQLGEKILVNWIKNEVLKQATTKASSATSAVQQVSAASGVAAANTYAAISAIPMVGPEMAPEAAAGAASAVMGFSSLAFASQGMLLDRDRLVFAHKDEQILPAHLSKGIQNIISNGGTSNGGDTHLNFSPTINGGQNKSLDDMLFDESQSMRSWAAQQKRIGAF